jgi:hypothetical protein
MLIGATTESVSFFSLNSYPIPFPEDTKLMDVKISELPAWIGRRDKSLGAIYNELARNILYIHTHFYSGPVYGSIVKTIARFVFAFMFFNWFMKQHRYWAVCFQLSNAYLLARCFQVKKNVYHW